MSLAFSASPVRAGAVVNDLGIVCDISQGSLLFFKTLKLNLQHKIGLQVNGFLSLKAKIRIFHT